jgi:hypothetical protein
MTAPDPVPDHGPVIGDDWPLPAYAHCPGTTPRPNESPAFDVARSFAAPFFEQDWPACEAYCYGFFLYRNGCYWEAHEVWEAVWQGCRPNSRERVLLQALIQIANAELKGVMGRPRARQRLLQMAGQLLLDVAPPAARRPAEPFLGVELDALRTEVMARVHPVGNAAP